MQQREDIDSDLIGLYGASEGGSIVFRAASLSKDIAFGITVSTPAVPHYQVLNSLIKSLSAITGLRGVQLEKLVSYNLLLSDLLQNRSTLNNAELQKKVAAWNDPAWSQLISLVENKTDRNREATIESFIAISQNWEKEEWFGRIRILRLFYKQLTQNLGMELADFGIDANDQHSARSHVEFAAAVVEKIIGSDPSRNEDPVSFLKEITCPILCIYGQLDQTVPAAESVEIIRKVFAETKHKDLIVEVFPGAGHQLEITKDNRTVRHPDFDKLVLDWVQERVRND